MDSSTIKTRVQTLLASRGYKPATMHEISVRLNIPAKKRTAFLSVLNKMRANGEITLNASGKIVGSEKTETENATILSVGKNGAFARLDDRKSDVFIYTENLNGAMPSDKVKVKVSKQNTDRPRGVVLKITERGFVEFTGIFHRIGKRAFVTPDAKYKGKLRVDSKEARLLNDGDMVFCRMKFYEKRGVEATASIVESYGAADSAAACCQAILDKYHARKAFSKEVTDEAARVSEKFSVGDKRLDLRALPIFTIDGASAKDLDDAVSVEQTPDGFRLGVHIADVSHYVRAHSKLDDEAFARGTSIYFGNSVVPMLPKELSNGICSLNPEEDRLAFSAFMEIDRSGRVTESKLYKSVIRSRVKGVYEEVNRIYDESAPDALIQKYAELLPELKKMRTLAQLLREARSQRGAFDFQTDESFVVIGEDGRAAEILRRERGEAERMIEEFMLCANEAVATFAFGKKLPFLYRIHEEPDQTKLTELSAALAAAGIEARAIRPGLKPRDIKSLLSRIEESPRAKALNSLILRSMSKAKYSPECIGHFGLALSCYCHFTSPIRRYPDLAIHRILSDLLNGRAGEEFAARYSAFAADASATSSAREVAAMQIEWACEDCYKAEYMSAHIGERFEATVSTIKGFGMYVMLENTVEGLVKIENMPGWFDFDEQNMTLRGGTSGVTYSVGDRVEVILAAADIPSGKIDFTLL